MARANRSVVLAAGMLIQLCAGIVYMWSVFKAPVAQHLAWDPSAAAFTSSVMLAAFVVGLVCGGQLQDKLGPRKVLIGGSLIFSLGMMLTSLATRENPAMVYLTYGVIGGAGVGAVYTTTVSVIQKWYPDRRGFATGMMVSAFGFSLVIFMPIASRLLEEKGVPFTFTAIGLLFLVVCSLSSLPVINPPADYTVQGAAKARAKSAQKHYTTREMLKTPQFYRIFFSMMLILPAYFILNPQFLTMGMERGLSDTVARLGVMTTGVASAAGRLLFSWASDRIGRKNTIYGIIAVTLAGVLMLIFAQGLLFMACIAMIAFAFGGCASVYPALTADNFGTKYMGLNYGCVMIGFGIAALGAPKLAGALTQDATHTASFIMAAVLCVIALVMTVLIQKTGDEQG
jgi:OFA family oxalate/formate antiporter-like MFS transporter